MLRKELGMENVNMKTLVFVLVGILTILMAPLSRGYTYDQDVYAINNLYVALGSPVLPGWIPNGGDPCTEFWQGVSCVNSNITSIILPGANLGGQLGVDLFNFSSMITIDLSSNHIGGSIPSNLPSTMQRFFLSANQFTGSIPSSLSTLSQLTALSLNNNLLTGEIPDSFQPLVSLVNLDLSFNNLSGQLPSSLQSLSSLTTLHLQNNQLTGILDVLQDLPLTELNVENNLFWGPVPENLYNIPNFQKEGNPFNTSIAPSPPPPPPPLRPSVSGAPTSEVTPPVQSGSRINKSRKFWTTGKIVAVAFVGVVVSCIFVLVVIFCISCIQKSDDDKITKRQEMGSYKSPKAKPKFGDNNSHPSNQLLTAQASNQMLKAPKEVFQQPKQASETDMRGMGEVLMPPPPPPPPVEKVIVNPIVPATLPKKLNHPTSVKAFTVAALQQYTNSFTQETFIEGGMLGNVYRAELPGGKALAVKKLHISSPILQSEESFLDLVTSIAKLQHRNVVKLEGYCVEHGQRLLIYEYCSYGTLYEALHSNDEDFNKKLSWNVRIRMALGIARALEYLHETCEPPVVHQNFKSSNVLLDDELAVHVSDCGLAPLIRTGSISQLSGHLLSLSYSDPQSIQSDAYTSHSDVYSFGVVMLELFTGRKPYDSSQPRGQQSLVEWARHQLHDFTLLQKMVDPSLSGTCTLKSMSKFADIISLCVQSDPSFRPPMSDIVQRLLDMMPSRRRDGDASNSKIEQK